MLSNAEVTALAATDRDIPAGIQQPTEVATGNTFTTEDGTVWYEVADPKYAGIISNWFAVRSYGLQWCADVTTRYRDGGFPKP